MSFEDQLRAYSAKYKHGCYCYCRRSGVNWTGAAKNVPKEPGVYIFFKGCICEKLEAIIEEKREVDYEILREVLYIGKAGTLLQNGVFKDQKLDGRIAYGKRQGIRRSKAIPHKMKAEGIDCITVLWFVTFSGGIIDLPGYAEALLMQEFHTFSGKHNLPLWNLWY